MAIYATNTEDRARLGGDIWDGGVCRGELAESVKAIRADKIG